MHPVTAVIFIGIYIFCSEESLSYSSNWKLYSKGVNNVSESAVRSLFLGTDNAVSKTCPFLF